MSDDEGSYGNAYAEEDCDYEENSMGMDEDMEPPCTSLATEVMHDDEGGEEDAGDEDAGNGEIGDQEEVEEGEKKEDAKIMYTASPLSALNTGRVNERGFHVAEVNMLVTGSLRDFATGKKKPVLKLEDSFAGFETPGKGAGNERKTVNFAQGRVHLLSARSTFPCAIALVPHNGLRGVDNNTVWTQSGLKCAHIVHADDKYSYAHNPLLLLDSEMGSHTEKFEKKFPSFLNGAKINEMYRKVPNNTDTVEVRINTPLFHAINGARERMLRTAESNGNQLDLKLLDSDSEHAKIQGYVYAPASETLVAAKRLKRAMRTQVNYTPLYENLMFTLHRAFTSSQASESGSSKAAKMASWLDAAEIGAKKKRDDPNDSAFDEQHTLTARFLVEYKPLSGTKNK